MTPTNTAAVAIDLGSSVITTVIGERREHGELHILGVGQAPSAGVEAGQISHVSRAAAAIRHSLDQAEASSGRQILSAGVAISGPHLQSINNRGAVALPPYGEPIRDHDLQRAIDSAKAVQIDPTHRMLHALPRFYVIDSELRSFDPRGQHGNRLDVSMHFVSGSNGAIKNAGNCIEEAGIEVELLAAKPVVASERAVSAEEKEYGALVIGLDAGTTTLTAYEDGAIAHTSTIAIGTAHIARDISVGLHCGGDEARRVMQTHGVAVPQLIAPDAPHIELQRFAQNAGSENGAALQPASPAFVADIIHARVCEVISRIQDRITDEQLHHAASIGIVLTGGGASLGGIDLLFSKAMQTSARIADVGELHGLTDKLRQPDALGAVGMLEWLIDQRDTVAITPGAARGPSLSTGSMIASLTSSIGSLAKVFSPNSRSS